MSEQAMTTEQLTMLMNRLAEQNLQIALVFEKILAELKAPEDASQGFVRVLERLLAPLVDHSGQIMDHLGIPPTRT